MNTEETAQYLKSPNLSADTLTELGALGWRAMKAQVPEVTDAVGMVICALQGNWEKPTKDELMNRLISDAAFNKSGL